MHDGRTPRPPHHLSSHPLHLGNKDTWRTAQISPTVGDLLPGALAWWEKTHGRNSASRCPWQQDLGRSACPYPWCDCTLGSPARSTQFSWFWWTNVANSRWCLFCASTSALERCAIAKSPLLSCLSPQNQTDGLEWIFQLRRCYGAELCCAHNLCKVRPRKGIHTYIPSCCTCWKHMERNVEIGPASALLQYGFAWGCLKRTTSSSPANWMQLERCCSWHSWSGEPHRAQCASISFRRADSVTGQDRRGQFAHPTNPPRKTELETIQEPWQLGACRIITLKSPPRCKCYISKTLRKCHESET